MATITLELTTEGTEQEIVVPLSVRIQKRPERFIYSPVVPRNQVPIVYLESEPLDSWENLQIVNRTYGLSANAPRMAAMETGWIESQSKTYTSQYKEILATHVTARDHKGIVRPLFWKHTLPEGTTNVEIYRTKGGNKTEVDYMVLKDLENDTIYTNYHNYYDPATGSYELFFLTGSTESGEQFHQLLSPEPVAREATWEDIDLDTGKIKSGIRVFMKSKTPSGYVFNFNTSETWYIRPTERSLIQPLYPTGRSVKDPWHIRFSHGDVSTLANGSVRRYWLPEYETQPFFPSKPTVYSPYSSAIWVSRRILAATRTSLAIQPQDGLHLTVFISDPSGELIKVLSTDKSLEGKRYLDTPVRYDTNAIESWDNASGLILLGFDLMESWEYSLSYYHNATDYEYPILSLNPIENRKALSHMFVFYMVPDAPVDGKAIHHLVVDEFGTIIECSQPDYQLRDSDGDWNPDTIIGMKYSATDLTNTWLETFSVGYGNDYAYYVLAEVTIIPTTIPEELEVIDVSRVGGIIAPEYFEQAIRANPRILQSRLGYGESGQEVPRNGVVVVDAPITLLERYGGPYSEEEARAELLTHMDASGYGLVRWIYPESILEALSEATGQVSLSWTWEGPDLTYRVYRSANPAVGWELIHEIVDPPEGQIQYTDTRSSGTISYYGIRIYDGSVEYPMGNQIAVKVM